MNQPTEETRVAQLITIVTEPQEAGLCYCCRKPLTEGRVLWCAECADPKGFVAMASRMLRRKGAALL